MIESARRECRLKGQPYEAMRRRAFAARSETPGEITDNLARAGIPLDIDTVRKWLREAAVLLPLDDRFHETDHIGCHHSFLVNPHFAGTC